MVAQCIGSQQQKWNFTYTDSKRHEGVIRLLSDPTQCLDIDYGSEPIKAGDSVKIAPCDGRKSQLWIWASPIQGGTITVSSGGLCLDITGANEADCAAVEIWTCNGQSNQRWRLFQDQTIRTASDGDCLQVGA